MMVIVTRSHGWGAAYPQPIRPSKNPMWGDCMGRPRFHRQNLLVQTNSVGQKCLFHWLVRESMDRFGLSFEEARSVAVKGLGFLNQETGRMINQIVFPLISAEYAHQREKYSLLPKRPVVLTPLYSGPLFPSTKFFKIPFMGEYC
ncbi:hypothetical protein GFC01_07205 [Desulfofundulus thermobenzoicus]|uniref:Uncharacterized protein n=1 Tax=Desulfofundulus thermobenzoicus TaxID=29376 RepID=A0A6N7ISG9_9FIRM|nr:hypothetical protein [Desulfofundulus thermobenzoicus]MQL52058.1 hypothetical protein [Desulfofundulus thermobenzoicus]